jgi:glycosyltransferase involved in cell wall biosynthesis
MHIGIDARLVNYRRGMGQFIYNTLPPLVQLAPDVRFTFYVDHPAAISELPRRNGLQAKLLRPGFYPVWEQVLLPQAAAQDRIDLLYAPANTAPISLPKSIKLVITIYDVMYMLPTAQLVTAGSAKQRLGRIYRRTIVPLAARNAARVTTSSTYSGHDIMRYIRLDSHKLSMIYGAANPIFSQARSQAELEQVRERLRLPQQFVLALGAIDPRKNTRLILEAFAQTQAHLPIPYQLVVTGLNEAARATLVAHAHAFGIADRVLWLGFVSEAELAALYRLATLFVYPSLYEGFGLPVLEAMVSGTPVIASNLTSIPEIAGDAALLVEPNLSALASGMLQTLNNPEQLALLRQRGLVQAEKFRWERTAQLLLDAFYKALKQ